MSWWRWIFFWGYGRYGERAAMRDLLDDVAKANDQTFLKRPPTTDPYILEMRRRRKVWLLKFLAALAALALLYYFGMKWWVHHHL